MKKFDFLIGNWNLIYNVPQSFMSEKDSGKGEGAFRRTLRDKYVYFDYRAHLSSGSFQAHGIFAFDAKNNFYRYWWFEDSGNYMTASCHFTNKNTLFMNWHDSLLIQTFEKIEENQLKLKMSYPEKEQIFKPVLLVDFFRK